MQHRHQFEEHGVLKTTCASRGGMYSLVVVISTMNRTLGTDNLSCVTGKYREYNRICNYRPRNHDAIHSSAPGKQAGFTMLHLCGAHALLDLLAKRTKKLLRQPRQACNCGPWNRLSWMKRPELAFMYLAGWHFSLRKASTHLLHTWGKM